MRRKSVEREVKPTLFTSSLLFGALGGGMVALAVLLPPKHFQVLIGSAIVGIAGLALKSWIVRNLRDAS